MAYDVDFITGTEGVKGCLILDEGEVRRKNRRLS